MMDVVIVCGFFWLGRGSKVVIALLLVIPCVPGANLLLPPEDSNSRL